MHEFGKHTVSRSMENESDLRLLVHNAKTSHTHNKVQISLQHVKNSAHKLHNSIKIECSLRGKGSSWRQKQSSRAVGLHLYLTASSCAWGRTPEASPNRAHVAQSRHSPVSLTSLVWYRSPQRFGRYHYANILDCLLYLEFFEVPVTITISS